MDLIDALETLKTYCHGRSCSNCALRESEHEMQYGASKCYVKNHNPATWEIAKTTSPPRIFK